MYPAQNMLPTIILQFYKIETDPINPNPIRFSLEQAGPGLRIFFKYKREKKLSCKMPNWCLKAPIFTFSSHFAQNHYIFTHFTINKINQILHNLHPYKYTTTPCVPIREGTVERGREKRGIFVNFFYNLNLFWERVNNLNFEPHSYS